MRFSHISDIHLGFTQFGLDERERDVYAAFEQAIDKSIEDKVEFVIFGGDIFHIPNPRGKAQIKFANALKRLNENNISSYFVLGEHDISNVKDTPVSFIPHKFGFTNYLENGKPFYPDFVMFLTEKKTKKEVMYQIFIEPKGDQFLDFQNTFEQSKESWKQKYLLDIETNHSLDLKIENKEFCLIGLPFYNEGQVNSDLRTKFEEIFAKQLY